MRTSILTVLALAYSLTAASWGQSSLKDSFDASRAMAFSKYVSTTFGPRPAGSPAVKKAIDYVEAQWKAIKGCKVRKVEFMLPDGKTKAWNVIADMPGKTKGMIALAGHVDTVPASPGANDDASGIGAMLEIARVFSKSGPPVTIRFYNFGAEEEQKGFDGHGYASYVQIIKNTKPDELQTIRGCIWLDKVAVGKYLNIYDIAGTTDKMAVVLQEAGKEAKEPADLRPPAAKWQPHMAFEDAKIPTGWIEWHKDPNLHTPQDTYDKMDQGKLASLGKTVVVALEMLGKKVK